MNKPKDWPAPGPIDLAIHDLPHASSATEWWYVNTHFRTAGGRDLSLFASFFRVTLKPDPATREPRYSHFITWALSDANAKMYYPTCEVDASVPREALARLRSGRGTKDRRVSRAMQEVLERGHVPLPDRMFQGEPHVSHKRLSLDYAGSIFRKNDDGSYALELDSKSHGVSARITFHPEKAPIRHGDDGVVRGVTGEDMFYYFIPRCRLTGSVSIGGTQEAIASGAGWYDHEFGGHFRELSRDSAEEPVDETAAATAASDVALLELSEAEKKKKLKESMVAWNWAAVQLDDGTDVSAYALYRVEDDQRIAHWTIVVDPDGTRHTHTEMSLESSSLWRSTRTFHDYPMQWRLRAPDAGLDLTLSAAFDDQEIITVVSKPAFWEGRLNVTGTHGERAVTGLAFVERSGFEPIGDLDDFFSAVSETVRLSVEEIYPLDPTPKQVMGLIASENRPQYMLGVDTRQIGRALIQPVREITDRGGKGWRSYALLACCDVVLGDSRPHVKWLALPELMHVGSLVVDDVQDKSTVRRGGQASHVMYGEGLAINAGTAAYFMAQKLISVVRMTPSAKLRLYDLYFEAMRAGHAGQAMDLDGVSDLMPDVIATGDASALEQRVLGTHRLKTAAPAGALARMGAVMGEGSDAQIEAVGNFFESLGLAFQIMDDVLNLRGFRGDLKARAEDISHGKVTLPVVKALGRFNAKDRQWLWDTLQSQPTDMALVSSVVERLESVGAIEACVTDAQFLVEAAWSAAEPLLPDSVFKIMLRAFGWFVLERHY